MEEVPPAVFSFSFFFLFEKLRKISCMMLGASLRDSSLEVRREKDRLSTRMEERWGTMARINDKRVHESFANVLISGERKGAGESVFFLMEGYEGGG